MGTPTLVDTIKRRLSSHSKDILKKRPCSDDCNFKPRSRTLGEGKFGVVRTAKNKKTGKRYAVKIIDLKFKSQIRREVAALEALHHKYIVKFEHFHVKDDKAYIYLELIPGLTLEQTLEKDTRVDERQTRIWLSQLVQALGYIHDEGYSHKDIKERNIVLTADNEAKLIDFGLCQKTETRCKKFMRGTLLYLSPEILLEKKYDTRKADIWALGIVLYRLLTGNFPWPGTSIPDMLRRIQMGSLRFPEDVSISNEAKDLIRSMLHKNPSKRPNCNEILSHKWIKA